MHFSENPGLNPKLIEEIRKLVHGKEEQPINKITPSFKDVMDFEVAA